MSGKKFIVEILVNVDISMCSIMLKSLKLMMYCSDSLGLHKNIKQ